MSKGLWATLAVIGVIVLGVVGYNVFMDDDADNTTTTETEQTDQAVVDEGQNIVELAQSNEDLSILVEAVVAADLATTLSDETVEYTVFAPTNEAFENALEALDLTKDELLASEDLAGILTYHVVEGEALSSDLSDGQELTTVNGEILTVSIMDDGSVMVGEATVVTADVDASNGVVHVIDTVLLP